MSDDPRKTGNAVEDPPDISWGGVAEEEGVVISPILALDVIRMSEINQAMEYSRQHPRKLSAWRRTSLEMITLSADVAGQCFYSLPRWEKNKETGKKEQKNIVGPSSRFAEIIAQRWGNARAGAQVLGEDEAGEFVRAQGLFHDLETNFHLAMEVKRRITTSRGDKYNADMIQVTGMAAASIAYRNTVLRAIPKALWFEMFEIAKKTFTGNVTTLKAKRDTVLDSISKLGVPLPTLFEMMGIGGKEDINGDVLIALKGLENNIRSGEKTVEDVLADWTKSQMEQPSGQIFTRGSDKLEDAMRRADTGGRTQGAPPSPPTGPAKTPEPPGSDKGAGGLFQGEGPGSRKKP